MDEQFFSLFISRQHTFASGLNFGYGPRCSVSAHPSKKDPAPEDGAEGFEYWYPGSTETYPHAVVRTACRLAWPKALYYATHYHSDLHVAHELMDEAVAQAQRYYDRNGKEKTVQQVWYYVVGCLKRLSMRRSSRTEVSAGTLSDLELIAQHMKARTLDEERVFLSEVLGRMTPRTRRIFEWRAAGHSFRAIAKQLNTSHATLVRAYNKELRELIFPDPSATQVSKDKNDG